MKERSFEAKLKEAAAPPPDPAARLRAKRAALAEFAQVHAARSERVEPPRGFIQGLAAALRLSRDGKSHGRDSMAWSTKMRLFAGAASVCVAVIGFAVVWPVFKKESSRPQAMIRSRELPLPEPRTAATPATPAARPEGPQESAVVVAPPAAESAATRLEEQKQDRLQSVLRKTIASGEPQDDVVPSPAPLPAAQQPPAEPPPAPAGPIVDAITTEDIGKFPDASLAEALKRVPAVQQSRPGPYSTAVPELSKESVDEVIVTGARGSSQPRAAPHKGVAPPQPGYTVAGNSAGALALPSASGALKRMVIQPREDVGRDKFEHFEINPVKQVADDPVSTFSVDVDTASYSFVRRQLNAGVLPQKDAVRVEEMINYFNYSWPVPDSRERPFKPTVIVSDSPWGKGRKLVHIGIKGYELAAARRPDANLVLLLDVSGSMDQPDKLPLAKSSMRLLLGSLKPTDTVAIVVYAGQAGMVLAPTPVGEKEKILEALDGLTPGGSTAGAQGIELAYALAEKHFRKEGVNRILLATDGDFNVGITDRNELKGFVERQREKGIFLSVLGFGQGNYRDELAQALAQNGNGVAAYIDTLSEAQKVLVQEAGSSLFTIAKDVKLQMEFNPATVAEYRLVGYETRALKREDFNNDAVDAGDVGAGHTVTAIYEITPVGAASRMVDERRYGKNDREPRKASGTANEYGFLKIRYKLPDSSKSQLLEQPIAIDTGAVPAALSQDVQFSSAVAGFAQLLRGGSYTGALSFDDVIRQALASRGEDPFGYRNEFVQLVRKAQTAKGM